jgi:hypothetical protein
VTLVLKSGDLQGKPFKLISHVGDPQLQCLPSDPGGVFAVSSRGPTTFTREQTGIVPLCEPPCTKSVAISQQAAHGTVTLNADGSFTYTPEPPDPETGEPYFGWDFFSVIAREAGGFEQEQWVQLNVGIEAFFVPPPPKIVTDPVDEPLEPRSEWVPMPFDGTLDGLESKLNLVRIKRNQVFVSLAELGQAWQAINDDQDPLANFDANTSAVIAALDAAQSAYLTYHDGWLELNANSAGYQKTWRAYWDNLWDGERYNAALMGVQGLPRDIGGLQPNADYLAKITRALAQFGDAAGFQSNLAGTVFTVANTTHQVLEKAEYTLGLVTGGTYTAASFTTKAGLAAIAKTVARNYVIGELAEQGLTPVINGALSLLAQANINVSPNLVRAGLLALQASGAIKAGKAKLKTAPRPFEWHLGGKAKPSGINFSEVRWTKVSDAAYDAITAEFNNTRRAAFLKSLANDPAKVKAMKKAGLTKGDIDAMKAGNCPAGYEVHHKKPRRFGGGNEDDNLMLVRSTPGDLNMHSQLTNLQGDLTGDMVEGQSRTVEFPMFEGKYFANERGTL